MWKPDKSYPFARFNLVLSWLVSYTDPHWRLGADRDHCCQVPPDPFFFSPTPLFIPFSHFSPCLPLCSIDRRQPQLWSPRWRESPCLVVDQTKMRSLQRKMVNQLPSTKWMYHAAATRSALVVGSFCMVVTSQKIWAFESVKKWDIF